MSEQSRLSDEQITGLLRRRSAGHAPDALTSGVLEALASERALHPVRAGHRPARRPLFLLAAAALLVVGGAAAAGAGVMRLWHTTPVPPPPSVGPIAIASPDTASPTPSAPARPSESPVTAARGGGTWILTGPMTTPRRDSAAVRLLDGRVLVTGGVGSDGSDLATAELYDPGTGTWTATGSMIHPPGVLNAATLLKDGRVLVEDVAGDTGGAELYDPATGTWTATGKPRATSGGAPRVLLADGTVLRVGDGGDELYDPASGTWTPTGRNITRRYNGAAILLPDGRVLIAGGDTGGDQAIGSAEIYDPRTGAWTAAGNAGLHRHPATLLGDGTVLLLGGPTPELFDPASGEWTPTRAYARPDVGYQTATRLLDGTVLVAGGRLDTVGGLAEVYDPSTGSWSVTGSMLLDPWGGVPSAPATLLSDGTVLVAGGAICPSDCPSHGVSPWAELYVPAGVTPPDLGPFASPAPPPTPTPTPTMYPPEVGPAPQGARPWTVKVENDTSQPATLFLAVADDNGLLGRLCGSVTPNVVPAGVTENVTMLLPPRSDTDCAVWLDPAPGLEGPMFQTSELPRKGYFLFRSDDAGTSPGGWVGPGP
jgi:hypothetical protein